MLKTRMNQRTSISRLATAAFVLFSFAHQWTLGSDDLPKQGDRAVVDDDRQKSKSDDPNVGLSNQAAAADSSKTDNDRSVKKKVRLSGMMRLLMNESVLRELGIEKGSEEYKEFVKLATFSTEVGNRISHPTDEDRAERLTTLELRSKVESEQVAKLKERLKPEQYARWRQLWLQQRGITAVEDTDVANQLGITDEQRSKLAALNDDITNRYKVLHEEYNELATSGKDVDANREKTRRLYEEKAAKYREILTLEQLENFDQMKGKPFELGSSPPANPAKRAVSMQQVQARTSFLLTILAANLSIQNELGIKSGTPVANEIRDVSAAYQRELGEARQADRRSTLFEATEKLQDKYLAELRKLITPDQFTRLQQIDWQRRGISVLNDPEVRNLLEITDEQQKQIDDSWDEMIKKGAALRPRGRVIGEPIDPEVVTQQQALRVEHEKRVNEILSASQKTNFAELKGRPFDTTKLRLR